MTSTPSEPTRALPALLVHRGDPSWAEWMTRLSPALTDKAEAAGVIEVTARWPSTRGARCLRVPPAANQHTNHRTGERT